MRFPNIQDMKNKGLIDIRQDLLNNITLGVFSGSVSYGTNTPESDVDIFCVTVPSREELYPYSHGHIYGFGPQPTVFQSYQKSHIEYVSPPKTDLSIWSIVKFFNIARGGPNVIDILFVPEDCVYWVGIVGRKILENRRLFLSKEVAGKYRGMSNSFVVRGDLKSQSHALRAKFAARDILKDHDYQTNSCAELVRSVKEGKAYFDYDRIMKELDNQIDQLLQSSTLRDKCDLSATQKLLQECLDLHYAK